MYILDTKTCLMAMKNESPELTRRILSVHPDEIAVSAVTLGLMEWELAGRKTNRQTELSVHLFLSSFAAVSFTEADAEILGSMRSNIEDEMTSIDPFDLMVIAQCISNKSTLITINPEKLSHIPGLVCENWTLPEI